MNCKLGRFVGLGIAVLVDVTEPFCIPFLLVGAVLYCAVAIPLALIYGGWVLARDRFTMANIGITEQEFRNAETTDLPG